MKYTKLLIAVSAIPLALALTGCKHTSGTSMGPGGGGSGPSLAEGNVSAVDKDGNPVDAAQAMDTKTDGKYQALQANAATSTAGDFAISKNDAGGVDMTVNGQTVSFAAADAYIEGPGPEAGQSYGWENDKGDLFSYYGGETKDILDGTDTSYLQVWGTYNSDKNSNDYAVVGAETPTSVIDKTTATASYEGEARVDMRLENQPAERIDVKGNMALDADFTARTVKGNIAVTQGRYRGNEYPKTGWMPGSGNIAMTEAKISGNGFSGGTLTQGTDVSLPTEVTQDVDIDISGSTYSGRFYGPNAEQVGGAINVTGTSESGAVVGQGYFAGDKKP
jgi:hypothetical protein